MLLLLRTFYFYWINKLFCLFVCFCNFTSIEQNYHTILILQFIIKRTLTEATTAIPTTEIKTTNTTTITTAITTTTINTTTNTTTTAAITTTLRGGAELQAITEVLISLGLLLFSHHLRELIVIQKS